MFALYSLALLLPFLGHLAPALTNTALPFLQDTTPDAMEGLFCPKGKCPSFNIPSIPKIVLNGAGTLL